MTKKKGSARDFSGKCDRCKMHKPYLYLNATDPKKVSKECWDCIRKSLPLRSATKKVVKTSVEAPKKKPLKKRGAA